uniref:(northern house mosquito) hypothetical protein n=1 Tax=Culex pipiens TaxID=7175 RepID=A0A8D8B7A4_CULPI
MTIITPYLHTNSNYPNCRRRRHCPITTVLKNLLQIKFSRAFLPRNAQSRSYKTSPAVWQVDHQPARRPRDVRTILIRCVVTLWNRLSSFIDTSEVPRDCGKRARVARASATPLESDSRPIETGLLRD